MQASRGQCHCDECGRGEMRGLRMLTDVYKVLWRGGKICFGSITHLFVIDEIGVGCW